MLTGAARAARTSGVFRPDRAWILLVPLLALLVTARLFTLCFVSIGMSLGRLDFASFYAGRAGPWSLRSALLSVSLAATGWLLTCTLTAAAEYVRTVRRRGRRWLLPGGTTGRLLVLGCLLLLLLFGAIHALLLPTAAELTDEVRREFRTGRWSRIHGAVELDVPGIRAVCRENLDHPSRSRRLVAAMSLKALGEGTADVSGLLRSITREEFLDPANSRLMDTLEALSCRYRFSVSFLPKDPEKRWQEFRRLHIP